MVGICSNSTYSYHTRCTPSCIYVYVHKITAFACELTYLYEGRGYKNHPRLVDFSISSLSERQMADEECRRCRLDEIADKRNHNRWFLLFLLARISFVFIRHVVRDHSTDYRYRRRLII